MSGGRGPGFLTGAVLGGLLGAGLGLLFAPRTGVQTRQELALWRAEQQANRELATPLDELLDLGAAIGRGVLERFEQARAAARIAADETERLLTEEWERRRRGL